MAIIRLENFSDHPFAGWLRRTVDASDPIAGPVRDTATGMVVVPGRVVGDPIHGYRNVDIWCDLREHSGERTFDTAAFAAHALPPASYPNTLEFFGGMLNCNGVPMGLVSWYADGVSRTLLLRSKVGAKFVVDVALRWSPHQPAIAHGELLVTMSNPAVDAMLETCPPVTITFGDALMFTMGRPFAAPSLEATPFTDGQGRMMPFWCFWTRHQSPTDTQAIAALCTGGVCGIGIEKLYHYGNPRTQPLKPPQVWVQQRFANAVQRLHDWGPAAAGPASFSPQTGAQADQSWPYSEMLQPGGLGAQQVVYLSAMKLANRPCHYREANGAPALPWVRATVHMWNGRPHGSLIVSPDRFGQTGTVPETPAQGDWYGPDNEHRLFAILSVAVKTTGSDLLQELLAQQARIVLWQVSVPSDWPQHFQSSIDAARSCGWLGLFYACCNDNLADRDLFARLEERMRKRCTEVYLPTWANAPGGLVDVRWNAGTLGSGPWVMPWQISIAACGLWYLGDLLDMPAVRACALRMARGCVVNDWVIPAGSTEWWSVGNQPWTHEFKQQSDPYVPIDQSSYTLSFFLNRPDWFRATWNIPALWLVTRHDPSDDEVTEKARAIWAQRGPDGAVGYAWFPPES